MGEKIVVLASEEKVLDLLADEAKGACDHPSTEKEAKQECRGNVVVRAETVGERVARYAFLMVGQAFEFPWRVAFESGLIFVDGAQFGVVCLGFDARQAEFDAFGPGQRVAREGRLYGVVLFGGSCVGRQGAQYVTHGLLSWPCGNAVWGGGKAVAHEEGVCVVLWRHGAAKLALSGVPDQI